MWNCHSGPLDVSTGGSIGQSTFVCQVWCSSIQGIYSWFTGGSIVQSRFICQGWSSNIQGIYSWFTGDLSAKAGLSAKFCVAVFKASMLYYLGVSISQSRFICQVLCIAVFKASILYSPGSGGPSAKVGLSANFGVLVFKASLLYYLGGPSA